MSTNRSVKDDIRDYWSGRAATFDLSPGHEIFSEDERSAWHSLLTRHLGDGKGKRALDLACGTGVISLLLSDLGFNVTGLDLAEPMLDRAKTKSATRGRALRLFVGDAEATLEPDNAYDAVVTRHLVWTLPDPPGAFAEWHRVLKPGGRVVIVDGDFGSAGSRRPVLRFLARVARRFSQPAARPQGWDGQTHSSILSRVYFSSGCQPEKVVELLRQAGFADSRIDRDLGRIHRAQGRSLKLYQRLERASQDRFVVSARKPMPV